MVIYERVLQGILLCFTLLVSDKKSPQRALQGCVLGVIMLYYAIRCISCPVGSWNILIPNSGAMAKRYSNTRACMSS